jgi:hypothetical protein
MNGLGILLLLYPILGLYGEPVVPQGSAVLYLQKQVTVVLLARNRVPRWLMNQMTLKAPHFSLQEPQPRRVPVPSIARQLLSLRGQEEHWEGTAIELVAIIGSRAIQRPKMHIRGSSQSTFA